MRAYTLSRRQGSRVRGMSIAAAGSRLGAWRPSVSAGMATPSVSESARRRLARHPGLIDPTKG